MRLVCPNCEAKYEVPDDAIPDTGRDVQCASCGHAWYQMRPRSGATEPALAPLAPPIVEPEPEVPTADTEAVADVTVPDDALAAAENVNAVAAEPEPAPEPEPDVEIETVETVASVDAVEAVAEVETVAAVEVAEAASADMPVVEAVADSEPASDEVAEPEPEPEPELEPVAEAKAAYAVDESVLAILREEAERETSARRAEARPLEVQADLGIESAVAAPVSAAASAAVEDKPSARRDLLPDVEEINSTLRPSETEDVADGAASDGLPAVQRSGGFRSGFLWVMTIAMLGAGLYLAAPPLSRAVPALADPLDGYVRMINSLRLELDGLMRSATLALDAD
jgi:predicted Zn finger-like uncharacterized protein